MLTVQILTKDNENTIGKTLESLSILGGQVVVGDLGSKDSTVAICEGYGAEVRRIDWRRDYSEARNSLVAPGMNLMVEPWETLVRGSDRIMEAEGNFELTVVRGSAVSKELRLWNRGLFRNPAYEAIEEESSFLDGVVLVGSGWPDRRQELSEICSGWRERRPTSPEPWYYSAFSCLSLGRMEEFLAFSERYLAMTDKFGPPEMQVMYRMAKVLFAKGDYDRAAGMMMECLFKNPTLAEFWCLLGDAFDAAGDGSRAKAMYQNALVMGCRRLASDPHPMDITKYKDYPEKMISLIDGRKV